MTNCNSFKLTQQIVKTSTASLLNRSEILKKIHYT